MGQQITKEHGAGHHGSHHGSSSHYNSSSGAALQSHFAGSSLSASAAPPAPKPLPSHLSDKVRIDNGGLVPQGVYTGPQDYSQLVVRQAIVDRRLAPFCKGSDDEDEYASERFNSECPICFLHYPSPLNFSRCCHQPICTECFVAMKRADPNHTNPPSSEARSCPFCVEPNFGVIYSPPSALGSPKAEGSGVNDATDAATFAEMAIGTGGVGGTRSQGKTKVLPAEDPRVITVDHVRPDWELKLAQAQAAVTRRANRRVIMRQVGDRLIPIGISSSRAGADLAAAAEGGLVSMNGPGGSIILQDGQMLPGLASLTGSSGRRRGRGSRSEGTNEEVARFMRMGNGQDMEELMMMEAMRLSLLEHEEQQKKQAAEEAAKRAAQEPGQQQQQQQQQPPPHEGSTSARPAQQGEESRARSSTSARSDNETDSPQGASASQTATRSASADQTKGETTSSPLPPAAPVDPGSLGLSASMVAELSELIDGGTPPSSSTWSPPLPTRQSVAPQTPVRTDSLGDKVPDDSIMSSPNRPMKTHIPAPEPVPVPEPVGNLGTSWKKPTNGLNQTAGAEDGKRQPVQISTSNAAAAAAASSSSGPSSPLATSPSVGSRIVNPKNPFRRSMGGDSSTK